MRWFGWWWEEGREYPSDLFDGRTGCVEKGIRVTRLTDMWFLTFVKHRAKIRTWFCLRMEEREEKQDKKFRKRKRDQWVQTKYPLKSVCLCLWLYLLKWNVSTLHLCVHFVWSDKIASSRLFFSLYKPSANCITIREERVDGKEMIKGNQDGREYKEVCECLFVKQQQDVYP